MSNPRPTCKFAKGNKASKGAKPRVAGIPSQKITKAEVERIFHLYLKHDYASFKNWLASADITVFDVMICRAIEEAIKEGDVKRIEFFLNRLIGKVADTINTTQALSLADNSLAIDNLEGGECVLKVDKSES